MYVGSHLQQMTLIIDTGSSWTWMPSKDCPKSQCPKDSYNYEKSTGYSNSGELETVLYGVGSIKGYIVEDDMALTKDG